MLKVAKLMARGTGDRKIYIIYEQKTTSNEKDFIMDELKTKVKAIIFDMDGTIVDTEAAWQNATTDLVKQMAGITEFSPEQKLFFNKLTGMCLPLAVAQIKEFFSLGQTTEEIMNLKLKLADFHLSKEIGFIHGFESFHTELQASNMPTCIATNAVPDGLKKMADHVNLHKFFGKNMYCIGDVDFKAKPDPALFLYAAQQLGAHPSECIVFEDSLYGFQAARAAGMKCIAIKNSKNTDLLDQVHGFIESYNHALEVLKKIS